MNILVFKLFDQNFAINTDSIVTIIKMGRIVSVPGNPSHIKGMYNFRGYPILIMDIRKILGLKVLEDSQNTCILIIQKDKDMIGIIADQVNSVEDIDHGDIKQFSDNSTISNSEGIINGVLENSDKITMVLNINKLIK